MSSLTDLAALEFLLEDDIASRLSASFAKLLMVRKYCGRGDLAVLMALFVDSVCCCLPMILFGDYSQNNIDLQKIFDD